MTEPDADLRERSIGELFGKLSAETSTLIRQEMALARAELAEKAGEAGKGAGLFGGAGAVGLLGAGALTAGIVLLLDLAIAAWLAAILVGLVYVAIAAFLGLQGREPSCRNVSFRLRREFPSRRRRPTLRAAASFAI